MLQASPDKNSQSGEAPATCVRNDGVETKVGRAGPSVAQLHERVALFEPGVRELLCDFATVIKADYD